MRLHDRRSILAIDPTSRGIAFVSFEDGKVMDWGERSRRREVASESRIVDALIDACAADVLVLEDPDAPRARRSERAREVLRDAARHARSRGVAVIRVARNDVRSAWANRGVTNKESVAREIAGRFVELVGVVPAKRRTGHNEDPRANIFDAASLALHAFE